MNVQSSETRTSHVSAVSWICALALKEHKYINFGLAIDWGYAVHHPARHHRCHVVRHVLAESTATEIEASSILSLLAPGFFGCTEL